MKLRSAIYYKRNAKRSKHEDMSLEEVEQGLCYKKTEFKYSISIEEVLMLESIKEEINIYSSLMKK